MIVFLAYFSIEAIAKITCNVTNLFPHQISQTLGWIYFILHTQLPWAVRVDVPFWVGELWPTFPLCHSMSYSASKVNISYRGGYCRPCLLFYLIALMHNHQAWGIWVGMVAVTLAYTFKVNKPQVLKPVHTISLERSELECSN